MATSWDTWNKQYYTKAKMETDGVWLHCVSPQATYLERRWTRKAHNVEEGRDRHGCYSELKHYRKTCGIEFRIKYYINNKKAIYVGPLIEKFTILS